MHFRPRQLALLLPLLPLMFAVNDPGSETEIGVGAGGGSYLVPGCDQLTRYHFADGGFTVSHRSAGRVVYGLRGSGGYSWSADRAGFLALAGFVGYDSRPFGFTLGPGVAVAVPGGDIGLSPTASLRIGPREGTCFTAGYFPGPTLFSTGFLVVGLGLAGPPQFHPWVGANLGPYNAPGLMVRVRSAVTDRLGVVYSARLGFWDYTEQVGGRTRFRPTNPEYGFSLGFYQSFAAQPLHHALWWRAARPHFASGVPGGPGR